MALFEPLLHQGKVGTPWAPAGINLSVAMGVKLWGTLA